MLIQAVIFFKAMGGQAVLDRGGLLAFEQVLGGGEELDQRIVSVGAGAHLEDELGVPALGFLNERGGHRHLLPAKVMGDDRGAPFRGPRGLH